MNGPGDHVVTRLAQLAQFGKHEGGISRGLATPQERAARTLFADWAEDAGLTVSQDDVGNLFARRNGSEPGAKPILIGSHLDTVPTGGAYDGAYGVAGAICALELLHRRNIVTAHPLEAVAWVGEEGSRFPLGCLGSSVFTGLTPVANALALVDDAGVSLRDALASRDGGLLPDVARRANRDVAAYLELHVEQGPVLEDAGISLGIVTAIAAQRRYRAVVEGRSGHAGTVPMDRRADALCAASELILMLEAACNGLGNAVVTVGRMNVEPNGTNVIPARVAFSIDARSPKEDTIDAIEAALQAAIDDTQVRRNVRVTAERLESRPAAPMSEHLRAAVRRAIGRLDRPVLDLPSGAGHDAMCLARLAPTAMIFVPSVGGMSHVGEEHTSEADLELGVEALAESIVEVDHALKTK